MKLFSIKGRHAKPPMPKTKYVELDSGKREIYRKYGIFDRWHYEGWYNA